MGEGSVDPREYAVEFFKEAGFERKKCAVGGEYFWTLNPEFDTCQDAPCVEYWFDKIRSREPLSIGESRRLFISFFEKRGHKPVPPRPVVARWRDDLYLTIASIVVFQPHVTSGLVPPPANPLVISQPSIRLEDIDNVGITIGRHLTSFEMAAHHAFNYPDKRIYWKDETVRYAFEFFTRELGIPAELIVFKESWWEGGGNAGPSFEVAVGGLELATLVFMQYKVVDGGYEPIPLKIVDTGYGVERIAWFTQKTPTAFHAIYGSLVDKFREKLGLEKPEDDLLWAAFRAAGRLDPEDPESLKAFYERVARTLEASVSEVKAELEREARLYSILDHTKTLALMLGDGVVPSNSGEGYLARLVLRRTLRQMRMLGVEYPLSELVSLQIEYWGRDFPQLKMHSDYILDAVSVEEKRYKETLVRGSRVVARTLKRGGKLGLEDLIRLYDTHGIPPEIVAEEARKRGVSVSVPHNFYSLVAARHKAPERIKSVAEEAELPPKVLEWARALGRTELLFHRDPYMRSFEARILGARGRYVVLDRTAFYPRGGGQDYDTGWLLIGDRRLRVSAVYKVGDVVVHVLEEEVSVESGSIVRGEIDWERRYRLMRHHTATHIILGAARRVLGEHVWQAGAEKTVEKGRLDITHHKPLTPEEIRAIERLANKVVDERRPVRAFILDRNEAEEKYGFRLYQGGVPMTPKIRVLEVADWDVEACFGTHLSNTGEVGAIRIVSVERIQDGVVRLEYVAGTRVAEEASTLSERLEEIARVLGAPRGREADRARRLLEQLESLESQLKVYREAFVESLHKRASSARAMGPVRILVFKPPESDVRGVQEILRELTDRHPELLAAALIEAGGQLQVELAAGKSVSEKIDLGEVARALAGRLGGKGGGRGSRGSARIPPKPPSEIEDILVEIVSVRLGG